MQEAGISIVVLSQTVRKTQERMWSAHGSEPVSSSGPRYEPSSPSSQPLHNPMTEVITNMAQDTPSRCFGVASTVTEDQLLPVNTSSDVASPKWCSHEFSPSTRVST